MRLTVCAFGFWLLLGLVKAAQDQEASKPSPVQQLALERQHLTRVLKSIDAIRKAPSFAARVRIFCRSQAYAFPSLPSLGTVEDLEVSYAELLRSEPATREQEQARQYALQVWSKRLSDARESMNVCRGGFVNYSQKLPTYEEEREVAAQTKNRIAEIDRQLAQRK